MKLNDRCVRSLILAEVALCGFAERDAEQRKGTKECAAYEVFHERCLFFSKLLDMMAEKKHEEVERILEEYTSYDGKLSDIVRMRALINSVLKEETK